MTKNRGSWTFRKKERLSNFVLFANYTIVCFICAWNLLSSSFPVYLFYRGGVKPLLWASTHQHTTISIYSHVILPYLGIGLIDRMRFHDYFSQTNVQQANQRVTKDLLNYNEKNNVPVFLCQLRCPLEASGQCGKSQLPIFKLLDNGQIRRLICGLSFLEIVFKMVCFSILNIFHTHSLRLLLYCNILLLFLKVAG